MIISNMESIFMRRAWLAYALILGFYGLIRLPTVLVALSYTSIIFPTDSLYLSHLLFDGLAVRSDIAATIITPSNAAFIYPPGIYIISALASKVCALFWVLFFAQLAVGPLFYFLMQKIVPRAVALVLALLSVYYFTRTDWWAPDFLIQPPMIVGVLLLFATRHSRGAFSRLLVLGFIAGLITVFKHNIGVFFSILCGTWFFLGAFSPAGTQLRPAQMAAVGVLLAGFFAFIPVIGIGFEYTDDWLYYLAPYAAFWILFTFFLSSTPLQFEWPRFLKESLAFSAFALLIPGLMFAAFGSVIGYSRYWYSLFGMGLDYPHIWDTGIAGVISRYQNFSGAGVKAFSNSYNSLIYSVLFLFPLAVNLLAVVHISKVVRTTRSSPHRSLMVFRVGSLGVMSIFMLYPLESYHILASKLFIFVFVGAYFLKRMSRKAALALRYALPVLLLPVILVGVRDAALAASVETDVGSSTIQRVIGLPLKKEIADELSRQVEVVQRSVKGEPYYVIDSSGATLIGLATYEDNRLPQYYVEMRPGLLRRDVIDAIKADLDTRPYVIVRTADYVRRNEADADPGLREIIGFIEKHYVVVDSYAKPNSSTEVISQVHDFLVMRRNWRTYAAQEKH